MKSISSLPLKAVALAGACVCALLIVPSAIPQGSLTPPAGAPAPAMKTLQQIEPRTDVLTLAGDTDADFVISQSGAYFLSGNLTVVKTNGIQITASNVTLDMKGFRIRAAGGTGTGILINGTADTVTVMNGSFANLANAVFCSVQASPQAVSRGGAARDLSAVGCQGASFTFGNHYVVENCRSVAAGGTGIVAGLGCVLRRCVAEKSAVNGINAGVNCTLEDCTSMENNSHGINLANGCTARGCTVTGNGATSTSASGILASSSVIVHCTATGNAGFAGINSIASTIQECTVASNLCRFGISVQASTVARCVIFSNFSGDFGAGLSVAGGLVENCTITDNNTTSPTRSGNTGAGVICANLSARISGCLISSNTGDGIQLGSNSTVVNCTCFSNDFAGIHVTGTSSRIDQNELFGNATGLKVDDIRNLITRNSARNNNKGGAGANYVVVAGNRLAQIMVPGTNAADVNGANTGSADGFSNVDALANTSF